MTREFTDMSWERNARRRRLILLSFVLIPTFIACDYMARVLPQNGATILEFLLVLFFGALYAWISVGFWTSMAGFFTLLRRFDRFAPSGRNDSIPIGPGARTAIVVPVCNEPVDRTFAGIYAVYRSVRQTERLDLFDFFILSDTSDPDRWVEEEAAWLELCRITGGHGRIFYRNRRANVKRKSGNIADFCRRWGYRYRYMIVLDADSVMTGPTLLRMVARMEGAPTIGILQTFPKTVNAQTLFARLQQFAGNLYGLLFSVGLHFWQLGEAQYWGHNAIIRVEPFIKHCGLPTLPGKPPLGGEILSHDFVEAALMRRAGWGVWLAYDLAGSYEELPPSLLDELKRDRRWCQGNIQHMKLLFTKGLFPAHRALFLAGAMAYVSGLLWFLFLAMSTAEAVSEVFIKPQYFPAQRVLFPHWPVWNAGWAIVLGISTALLLFLPKLLAVIVVSVQQGRAKEFGGIIKLLTSALIEVVVSALTAPIRMIFHSKFVFLTLAGREVAWNSQQRGAQSASWYEALRFHGSGMALGFAWSLIVLLTNPSFFWWLAPIVVSLIMSAPLSVFSSRSTLGQKFRNSGLLLTPQETAPPPELRWLEAYRRQYRTFSSLPPFGDQKGFTRAVVDPCVHALHLSFLRKERKYCPEILDRRRKLREKALALGPDALRASEKKELLCDPTSLKALHEAVWALSDAVSANRWGFGLSPSSCGFSVAPPLEKAA
ncbi:MAG: glucans biosynthesis glucosyltransferase MdoH [Syntrophobacteraceae bacterium]|nr:glucans biosynthesis glucosyltransferase MdoH [Syntrophobacteraceae bacterium]